MTPPHLLLGGSPATLAPKLLAHGAALARRPLTPAEGAELAAALLALAAEVRRLSAGPGPERAPPVGSVYDVCGACRNGSHDRCSAKRYPSVPAAACDCNHGDVEEVSRG